jgi:hypothetical protein
MTDLIVIESAGESFTRMISSQVARVGGNISVAHMLQAAELEQGAADVVIVSPSCRFAEAVPQLKCGILLTPGGVAPAFAAAECVVTYGMNPKDTLTLSSIGEDDCVLAIQRELVTICGGVLERQELKIRTHGTADESLACSGAMLLLGLQLSD